MAARKAGNDLPAESKGHVRLPESGPDGPRSAQVPGGFQVERRRMGEAQEKRRPGLMKLQVPGLQDLPARGLSVCHAK